VARQERTEVRLSDKGGKQGKDEGVGHPPLGEVCEAKRESRYPVLLGGGRRHRSTHGLRSSGHDLPSLSAEAILADLWRPATAMKLHSF